MEENYGQEVSEMEPNYSIYTVYLLAKVKNRYSPQFTALCFPFSSLINPLLCST